MTYPIDDQHAYKIIITDHVLDSIYGQIGLTEVERKLERLPIFKRLHSISQLELVNWIFPCALHTRYTHSIGVMHVANEMATRINANKGTEFFNDNDRQIIRLAAMLHDIGHYPLSHNIELAYKESKQCKKYDEDPVTANLKHYVNCPEFLVPSVQGTVAAANGKDHKAEMEKAAEEFQKGFCGSTGFHHEHMGCEIIQHNREIRKAIKEQFVLLNHDGTTYFNPYFIPVSEDGTRKTEMTEDEVDGVVGELLREIGEIVRGNYANENALRFPWQEKYSAIIQLIHSDLDADNLDYLLRDATFSGTSYGIMDMGLLLNCLTVSKFVDNNNTDSQKLGYRYIVGIQRKGIGAVEQFLLNKFLAYSQMILSKYVSILEAMLSRIEADYIIPQDDTYSCKDLDKMVKEADDDPPNNLSYLAFSDYYVLKTIFDIAKNPSILADLPKVIVSHLSHSCALNLDVSGDHECLCTSLSEKGILDEFQKSSVYKGFLEVCQKLSQTNGQDIKGKELEKELFSYRFEQYSLTKQIPISQFIQKFNFSEMLPELRFDYHYYRLGTGIPLLEKNKVYLYEETNEEAIVENIPELCVDSPLSSLHDLYTMQFVSLRKYSVTEYKS